MTRQRFSVDTNLLTDSIDTDAGLRHEQARDPMDALAYADCILTLQALAEFFCAAMRKGKMPVAEATALVNDWMELFPLAVADGRTLREAISLSNAHGFGFWDAMLVESARAAGVTRLLTENMQDGRRMGALLMKTPFKAGVDRALD
jgi:predicted nucleic acid-binding protein